MTIITKAEFDTLPESLKPKFKADGENYSLQEEDVDGLKRSKAEILAEKKRIQDEADAMKKRLDEIDANKSAEETELMKKRGEFEELEKKLRDKLTETETAKVQRENELLGKFKLERLQNELISKGVLPDRAKYALSELAEKVELVSDEKGFNLKVLGGIGDAKEFDALIEGMKATSPFFFAPNGASGSGASGSEGNGGGNTKVMKRSAFEQMPANEQMAFSTGGGKLED